MVQRDLDVMTTAFLCELSTDQRMLSCLRTAQAADIAGIRALLVHAKDETARQWYLNWEFELSPSDPFHLFLLMKDNKAGA